MIETIIVTIQLNTSIKKVWECFTMPQHITQWNFALDSWHCPIAENNLVENGTFLWRMEAKDGSIGFDYKGTYKNINEFQSISLLLEDNRKVEINFSQNTNDVLLSETFEVEDLNSIEMQKAGWQNILNNFKNYCESL